MNQSHHPPLHLKYLQIFSDNTDFLKKISSLCNFLAGMIRLIHKETIKDKTKYDELAQEKWGKDYAALDEDQQKAIRDIYPQKISEAEPKKYGEKK